MHNFLKTISGRPFNLLYSVILVLLLTGTLVFVQPNTSQYLTSVFSTKQALPYDGTVLPVQRVPKWTSLTSEQYKLDYSLIPADKLVPLPLYNPDELKTPVEQLSWKSDKDLAIRNAKITFSTPYMGNYQLDGIEYAGSHLSVDIKVPKGTPVYAIGNGVVTKVADQTTGFGKHIVIRHDNFPSLDDPTNKVTLYSSYSHLGELLVIEGDVVTKGQLIAKSGQTGTASTPHVHYQIDNSDAPWHPYWPFTYQEAAAAGLDFTSAINAGLGSDKALKTTINPMLYVQKYLDAPSATSVSSGNASTTPSTNTSTTQPSNISELPPLTPPASGLTSQTTPETKPAPQVSAPTLPAESVTAPAQINENPAVAFEVGHDGKFIKNAEETITVSAVDKRHDVVKSYVPHDDVSVKILVGGAVVPPVLTASSFLDGVATFQIKPTADSSLKLLVSDKTISGESGTLLPAENFPDVSSADPFSKAVDFLRDQRVIAGYSDGTFKPGNVVSRVEAVKFILKGLNSTLESGSKLPFKDTNSSEWYADFVATAYKNKLINGYSDGRFKPINTVSRAEFLKMLLMAINADVNMSVSQDLYQDVPKDSWFASYIQYAHEKNLISVVGTLYSPNEGMTRGEVAELLYRAIILKITGADTFSDDLSVTKGDLSSFYE